LARTWKQAWIPALRITAIYAAGATVWILASDWIVGALYSDLPVSSQAQTVKGLAFVSLTALALFLLIRHELRLRIKAENELERITDQTVQLNAQLARFAHATSHELVEPTRSMAGFAHILEKRLAPSLSPEDREMFTFLENGAKRMHRLVSDTATYAALDKAPGETRRFALDASIRDALNDLKLRGLSLDDTVNLRFQDGPDVLGYPRLLQSVFENLFANAATYADATRPPRIEVDCRDVGHGQIQVDVRDNGRGIPPEHRENVFLPFFRLETGERREGGSGFGLPACRRIVEWHGGEIQALDSPLGGTCIRFTLPRADL
jgi:signal transduction histidine kinase